MKRLLGWTGVAIAAGLAIGTFTSHLVRAQAPGNNSPFPPVWGLPYASIQRTYSVGYQIVPPTNATDVAQICGNASNLVKVTRIMVGGRATAISPVDIFLVRHSGQDTNPTNTLSPTAGQQDKNDSAPVSFVNYYWTVPTTLGTLTAVLDSVQIYYGNLTTGNNGAIPPLLDTFRPSKPIFLRGVNDCLVLNLSGTSSSGNLMDTTFEWTEE